MGCMGGMDGRMVWGIGWEASLTARVETMKILET